MKNKITLEDLARMTAKGFLNVEKRFDGVDNRIDKIDGRIDKIDGRIDKIDGRIDKIEHYMHEKFSIVEKDLNYIRQEIDKKPNRDEIFSLEERLTAVEEKMGIIYN